MPSLRTFGFVFGIQLLLLLLIATIGSGEQIAQSCGSDELNHSILVACNATHCPSSSSPETLLWPTKSDEILHVHSSKAGARLVQAYLANLNYEEDANTKLLDINTTLTVYSTLKKPRQNKITGFGASVDFSRFSPGGGDFEQTYGLILDDLFGESAASSRLTLLRLPIRLSDTNLSLADILLAIDQHVAHSRGYDAQREPLKILLDFEGASSSLPLEGSSLMEKIRSCSGVLERLSSIELWAVSMDYTLIESMELTAANLDYYNMIRKSLPLALIIASCPLAEAPKFLDTHAKSSIFHGLLVRGEKSVPYNVLDYLSSRPNAKLILSLGSKLPKTRHYGDWENAQNQAVELIRHLGHGSNGFIEELSVNELLVPESANQDSSLYSLHRSHQLHFKGPIFYATSHFSRFIPGGSQPVEMKLFTQPNMFSAHYAAYKTPKNQLVVVVLNSNEHMLPFRIEMDTRIVASAGVEPNSFNTFMIKL